MSEHAAAREEHMEVKRLPNEIQESIVSSRTLDLDSSIRKQDSAPDGANRGIPIQLAHASLERSLADLRIRIEE